MRMFELLRLESAQVHDRQTGKVLLHPVSMSIMAGRSLGIVGESGSAKSLLAKTIMGLLPQSLEAAGSLYFDGGHYDLADGAAMRAIRGTGISLVVQDGMSAFDPMMPIGKQFLETLRVHRGESKQACMQAALACFERLHLTPAEGLWRRYPHQLSGGQLQRMLIAMALLLAPQLIIADEPTTALDVLAQREVMQVLRDVVQERACTLVFISHDIGLVRYLADDVAVMQQGRVVELQPVDALWAAPQHPYTQFLLASRERLSSRFRALMQRNAHAPSA